MGSPDASASPDRVDLLLVLPPPWGVPTLPPFGIATLAGAGKAAGLRVDVIDLNARVYRSLEAERGGAVPYPWTGPGRFEWGPGQVERLFHSLEPHLRSFFEHIDKTRPRAIGFSIYGINLLFAIEAARFVRERYPDVRLLFGGPWTSFATELDYLVNAPIDGAVLGDGEDVLAPLLDRLDEGRGLDRIPGVERVEWCGGVPLIRPEPGELETGARADYSQIDTTLYDPGVFVTQMARGCPRRCHMCSDRAVVPYRRRPLNAVFDEIRDLVDNFSTTTLMFTDQAVNWDTRALEEVCDRIENEWPDLRWAGNAAMAPSLDRRLLDRMRASGCQQLNFGLESGSDRVLKLMRKGFTAATASRVLRDATAAGIRVGVNLVVGYPGETREDVEASKAFIADHADSIHAVQLVNPLMLNPGSDLWEQRDRFETYDLDKESSSWIEGSNTPWYRRALVDEVVASCAESGFPVHEVHRLEDVDPTDQSAAAGTIGDGVRWVFVGGKVQLSRGRVRLTTASDLFFDWDRKGERRISSELDWTARHDGSAHAVGGPITWTAAFGEDGGGVELTLSVESSEPVMLDRLKLSMILVDGYTSWRIGAQEGPFRVPDNWRKRWHVLGPPDENDRLPFGDGYRWDGPLRWDVGGESLPGLALSIEGEGFVPIAQGHCHPGGSVGFVRTGPLEVPKDRVEVCRVRLSVKSGDG